MTLKYRYCFVIALVLSALSLFDGSAQSRDSYFHPSTYEKYIVDHYDTSDGFIQNGVSEMLLDTHNYLWVNNQSGLIRMDGQRKQIYYSGNTPFIKGRRMVMQSYYLKEDQLLFKDIEGDHLIITGTELTSKGKSILKENGAFFEEVLSGIPIQYNTLEKFNIPGYQVGTTGTLIQIKAGCLYIRLKDQLYYYEEEQLVQQIKLPDYNQQSQLFVLDEQLYYLTVNDDINYYKINPRGLSPIFQLKCEDCNQTLSNQEYFKVYRNKLDHLILHIKNELWLVTQNAGQLEAQKLIRNFEQITSGIIYNPELDLLFISSAIEGLFVLKEKNPFFTLSKQNIYAFSEVTPGQIVMGDRIYTLSGQTLEIPNFNPTSMSPIWEKVDSTVFLGGDNRNYYKYTNQLEREKIYKVPKIKNADMTSRDIMIDQKKRYWFGNSANLSVFDPATERILVDSNYFEPFDAEFFCFQALPDESAVWLGTSKGIFSINPVDFSIEQLPFCQGVTVRNIQYFKEGFYLVGTYGDGLYIVQAGKAKHLPLDSNLSLAYTHAFVDDRQGFIWVSTNSGLIKLSKQELLCYMAGDCEQVYYYRFTVKDGLPTNEFNGGAQPNAGILSNGHLAFASTNGLVHFNPDSIKTDRLPETILINELKVDGYNYPRGDQIKLFANFKQLEFLVGTSGYWGNRDNLLFQYRIVGFHNSWQQLPRDGKIKLSRFGAGKYSLQIRLHKGLSITDMQDRYFLKTIELQFQPKFRETRFFTFLLIGLIFCISYLIYRFRTFYLRDQNKKLTALVEQKTADLNQNISIRNFLITILNHDFASSLKFSTILSKKLLKEQADALKTADSLEDLQLLNETLNDLYSQSQNYLSWMKTKNNNFVFKIESIKIHPIIQNTLQSLDTLAKAKGKKIINQVGQSVEVQSSSLYFQVLLFNLLDNAVKHTKGGTIQLKTKEANDQVIFIMHQETSTTLDHHALNSFFQETPHEDHQSINIYRPEGIGLYIIRDIARKNNLQLQLKTVSNGYIYEIVFLA